MKVRPKVKRLNEKQAKQALDDALSHLHWLTRGGEFAHEMETKDKGFCLASMKEFQAAKDWLDDFYGDT